MPPLTIVKPVPETVAEFTVTGELPVEVRVSVRVVGVFAVTLPKFRLVALTVSCGPEVAAAVPEPLSDTTVELPPEELLLIATCPVAGPAATGLNCTCSVTV